MGVALIIGTAIREPPYFNYLYTLATNLLIDAIISVHVFDVNGKIAVVPTRLIEC
jgi:hypothetical protein